LSGSTLLGAPESFGERVSRVAGYLSEFVWRTEAGAGVTRVELGGRVTIAEAAALWKRVTELLESSAGVPLVVLDFERVELIDGACMALLVHLRNERAARGGRTDFTGGSADVRRVVELYARKRRPRARRRRRPRSTVEQVGQATLNVFDEAVSMLGFVGDLAASTWASLRRPRSINARDVFLTMERAGADATPIVLLINFLIGFVIAYQSAQELARFGANIYVADLVGVSMTRELAPLMTAIILCGRTGAAFSAELGTMVVSEEVDGLRTLGFLPFPYLVMPRLLGLVCVAPLLTLLADAVGIAGGLVVGAWTLDVTPTAFWGETLSAVKPWDVWSGVLKSMVFAGAIAVISCHQGLATSGGAEGVGRRTTTAVVSILFMLILLDAVFTLLFGALGL
jgi:phospholipid/cholesterol/gamma-HCH transport system permease protein